MDVYLLTENAKAETHVHISIYVFFLIMCPRLQAKLSPRPCISILSLIHNRNNYIQVFQEAK